LQDGGLTLWVSWIDDCLVAGKIKRMKKAKEQFTDRFECNIVENFDEYVSMKNECNFEKRWIHSTQPVLIKSLKDEFLDVEDMQEFIGNHDPWINILLKKVDNELECVSETLQTRFHAGVGKLLHIMH